MKRNKHSLSHYRLLTGDMGRLIPIACFEVLPGDTVQQSTSLLVRVSPLMAPVMHPVSVRVHHWYVPHRIVWPEFEAFITGGKDGEGDGVVYPTISSGGIGFDKNSVPDYLGVPPEVPGLAVSALPIRAYNLIYNEYYRDQDLVPEIALDGINPPLACAWEKDYFTSSRPWPQKGPDVSMPLGVNAPVIADPASDMIPRFQTNQLVEHSLGMSASGTPKTDVRGTGADPTVDTALYWKDPNLIADLTNASAVNVNDVRRAFALQRYQEARARYGSRYTEYLRYLGVRSSDARLQRPEYLGGGKQTISFSEVVQTGPGSTEGSPVPGGVGALAGHGISAMRSRRYRRFFEEHGHVISLLSVRPRTMYTQALDRQWSRFQKEDYYQRELEQIGQQEIYRREIWAAGDSNGGGEVFGYQDRYSEYKHIQSSVHGEFRELLNYWHLGRSFASPPALNASFVNCDPSKRIHQEQTQHSLWCMVGHSIQARRMVRRSAESRII